MELVRNELQFYAKFARPLIFQLPDAKDRVLAAGWVKKIRDEQAGSEKLRTDYIKLLLFALQRKKLVGIFAEEAEHYEKLEEFPQEFDLNSMAKNLLKKEQFERIDRIRRQLRGQIGDSPPYMTDCSSDFREYVAAQDIPGFGVHCYYAISKEPIDTWNKADRGIFPKIAKSAVDTSSSVPPGFTGTSSDTSCICPPAPAGQDPACKAKVHQVEPKKKKKKRQKNLGKSPPSHPLGTAVPAEEREPPSWSSNLMEVKDATGTGGEITPAPSTGAISKRKIPKRLTVPVRLDESDMHDDDIKDIETALKDYERGMIKAGRQKKLVRHKKQITQREVDKEEGDRGGEDESSKQDIILPDDNFDDIEKSQYQDEVDRDKSLLKFFKGKSAQSGIKQRLAERNRQVKEAAPAKSGIPVTTPRPSALPRRQKSAEKIYEQDEQLPGTSDKGRQKKLSSSLKDHEVSKLYEEASAIISQEEEAEETKISQQTRDEEQPEATSREMNEDSEYQQLLEKTRQQEQSLYDEPPVPIQRGSPQANAIFSEAMDTLQEGSPLGLSDDWFEQMNTADGFLQGVNPERYLFPEDYGDHGLPEVISIQPNISPYKPYEPDRQPVRKRPIEGELAQAAIRTPSPSVRPASPVHIGSPSPAPFRSPYQVDPLGYTTPEHLKIKKAERTPSPQPRTATTPPRPPRSPSPPPPREASRSPFDTQLPISGDEFFFDMSVEQPPDFFSPEHSPDIPHILTVREASPRQDQVFQDIPPQNIIEAEPLGEDDMAQILDETSDANIFGEDMPHLEEGVDPIDAMFDMDDDYMSSAKLWDQRRHPQISDQEKSSVGFSLAKTIRETERRTDTSYVSPKPKKISKVSRSEIPEHEEKYIDFLFPEDQDMNQLIKRVSGIVADVEQDFPDPYHTMPASPEFPDVEGQDLFQETFPGLDYYSSPEPSPVAAPPYGIPAPRGAIPRRSGGIPKPAGATQRPAGAIPRPAGATSRPGEARARPAGAIPRPAGAIPRPAGAIPRPAGAIPRPAGAIPRPAGAIPKPTRATPRPASALPRAAGAPPIPAVAGSVAPKSSQARPAAFRKPIHAKEPLFFPQTQPISGTWPHMSLGFHRDMRDYQINEKLLDADRQRMLSRKVLVGSTAARRHDTRKQFRPTETIQEHPDESILTPRKYGPPLSPMKSPEIPAGPITFEDMAASYVPPIYVSPGPGIMEASPPLIDEEEDPQIMEELVYTKARERVPQDMHHLNRMEERRQNIDADLYAEIEKIRSPPTQGLLDPTRPIVEQQDTSPYTRQPYLPMYSETPMRQERRDRQRRTSRIPPGMRTRRIDFDQQDPDLVTETDKYIDEKLTQHKFALTPPEPPSDMPMQYGILDEQIPPDVRLPAPIRAPANVEGWRTPPWLSRRQPPPPEYKAELPPVDPNQWFFETQGAPEFTESPPALPDYDLGTPQLVHGGGQIGGLFFDEADELSPPPDLGPSPEHTWAPCGSPSYSPGVEPEFHPPPTSGSPEFSPGILQNLDRSPGKTITPRQTRPESPESDAADTPLGSFSGVLFTPSPDAHMKTPVTSAGRIFRAAGVTNSPPRYSPLGDPAAMEDMVQRVRQSTGRMGIRSIRENAALPRQLRHPPQLPQDKSDLRRSIEQRWVEEDEWFGEPEPRYLRKSTRPPKIPQIREEGTPPYGVIAPPPPQSTSAVQSPPRSPQDPHGLPKVLTFESFRGRSVLTDERSEADTKKWMEERGRPTGKVDLYSENDQYIQDVMTRQNLPPLSPQGPISPMEFPSPSSWEPRPPPTPDYDLNMPQVEGGIFFEQAEPGVGASPELVDQSFMDRTPSPGPSHGMTMATRGSPRGYVPDSFIDQPPSSGPSHDMTMATRRSPPGYIPDSFIDQPPSSGPSHGMTMATRGSPRGYVPDSFIDQPPSSGPSHGMTMATRGSPPGYMPDSFIDRTTSPGPSHGPESPGDMAHILHGADTNIYEEDMPDLEEGVDLFDILDMDNGYVPVQELWEERKQPQMTEEERGAVGYSVAKSIRASERRTNPNYVSPKPKKLPKVSRSEIPEQEEQYIDFLFPKDQDMNKLIKRVSGMVADIEQDFPDPYHIMPASLEFPDIDSQGLLQETSPDLEYYPSPETSPVAAPPCGIPAPRGAIPRRSGGIPTPGGAARRPAGALPRPTSALPRPTGAIPRAAGSLQRPASAASAKSKPSQARPTTSRKLIAKEPLFFPQDQAGSGNWPHMSIGFQKEMKDYQVNQKLLDADRQRMLSRKVLVGSTAARRHDTRKQFRPTETIQEHPDERILTPIKYGPALSPMKSPHGIMEASPPFIDLEEDPEIMGELTCGGYFDASRQVSRRSPQQDQFGLPNLTQLPPPRDIDLAPLRRPGAMSARAQWQPQSPRSPDMENYAPIYPPTQTSYMSPEYGGHLKLSGCRGAMIDPIEDMQLELPQSPEESPGRWQQMLDASPGRNDQGALMNMSPGVLQASPRTPSGSPSPDRVVSHSGSQTRCITARRLDYG